MKKSKKAISFEILKQTLHEVIKQYQKAYMSECIKRGLAAKKRKESLC